MVAESGKHSGSMSAFVPFFISPAGPDAGKAKLPAKPGTGETKSAQVGEVEQKKKVMQHPVYFVSSLLQGG